MTNVIRALLNLARIAFGDLVISANAVYTGLNLNPAFTNPPVPMATLRTGIDELTAAITAALDGGAKAIQQRNELADSLKLMLRQLAHYVEANCNGNMTTFMSSGFQPRTTVSTKTPPISESFRKIVQGSVSGQMLIVLMAISSAYSYEVRWASVPTGGVPGNWTSQCFGTTRFAIGGFTPLTTYAFQVRALTSSGYTDWSDTITRLVQ